MAMRLTRYILPECCIPDLGEEDREGALRRMVHAGGVEFNSLDGKPTQVVFLLMGNRREHTLHLKALARIARLTRSTTFMEKIVSSASVQDLVHALDEEEARIR
jgi:fructose PTS system EIIBC or EIIC component